MKPDFGTVILREMSCAPKFADWGVDLSLRWLTGRTLEIGCGSGNNLPSLKQKLPDVWGCDLNSEYLQEVKNSKILEPDKLFLWDITKAFPSTASFESFYCTNVIEHIENDLGALENIRAIPGLKRGVMIVPASPFLFSRLDKNLQHFRRYSRKALLSSLSAAGFRTRRIISFNRIGTIGWLFRGKVFKADTLGSNNLRIFNLFLPLFRFLDPFLPWTGLSYLAYVEVSDRQ